jgi:hypothetical protein
MDKDKETPSGGWHRRKLDEPQDEEINIARKDTILLKRLLSTALGHNAIDYWRSLRNYMIGKLKHVDFQRRAGDYLGSNRKIYFARF